MRLRTAAHGKCASRLRRRSHPRRPATDSRLPAAYAFASIGPDATAEPARPSRGAIFRRRSVPRPRCRWSRFRRSQEANCQRGAARPMFSRCQTRPFQRSTRGRQIGCAKPPTTQTSSRANAATSSSEAPAGSCGGRRRCHSPRSSAARLADRRRRRRPRHRHVPRLRRPRAPRTAPSQ